MNQFQLTDPERQVWLFIVRYYLTTGRYPSLWEIASEIKTSSLTVARGYIRELINKGYLWEPKKSGRRRQSRHLPIRCWPWPLPTTEEAA